ncbi:TnsA endonuclease N-terminal domain-containing protein [Bacillus sp. WLY-B-L8]|uniref:TnsA endonuclease N-terminal domain-containing protein n=1 Tax=Bacillus multifaciens TaxID=3068506 RepID=UPI0027406AA3|nr:TnsA endonuclease N-terminal domain-containing protein [Bacillus sp. WLY-B-L8]MDP7981246.1 TnsA endonuclease N-terminal domain-containing protein [Bacillus sp. WLY-B-L8]
MSRKIGGDMKNRSWTYKKMQKFLKEGRGMGQLGAYVPWIKVYDFPSKGTIVRAYGNKTNRIHHLLSNIEYAYFLLLNSEPKVVDIREQFPLFDLELAMHIANKIDVKYPTDDVTNTPHILTTDFMITTKNTNSNLIDIARTIKASKDLNKRRVCEKFEIERLYWKAKNIDWKIITEENFSTILTNNLTMLFNAYRVLENLFEEFLLKKLLYELYITLSKSANRLRDELHRFDKVNNLELGTAISLFYYLVLQRVVIIDVFEKIDLYAVDCSSLLLQEWEEI